MKTDQLRVLIVAEHASARFGGEAILPLHYFRFLRARGIDSWMVVHERTRPELTEVLGPDIDRVHFVQDTFWHRVLYRAGSRLPGRVRYLTAELLVGLLTQGMAWHIARRLVKQHRIDVIHQPIPVSPKEVSLLYDLPVPVVIGPMNGGMTYPPAFRPAQGPLDAWVIPLGRQLANWLNILIPGKRRAATLLVANQRTRRALPRRTLGRVIELVENGVDLSLWKPADAVQPGPDRTVRFLFAGRFDSWKGLDFLLEAFSRVVAGGAAQLDIIGDGALRPVYQEQAQTLGVDAAVRFRGWLSQAELAAELRQADVFVLPSIFECGGAVVLEAMAAGVPVVATRWGGPADYLDETCGILVEPTDREAFVAGLANAMRRLSADPALRRQMGAAGREKVRREFDWERKIDRILEVYAEAVGRARARN
jgi:glycosyltransferase involved in cell wall biosynthesis